MSWLQTGFTWKCLYLDLASELLVTAGIFILGNKLRFNLGQRGWCLLGSCSGMKRDSELPSLEEIMSGRENVSLFLLLLLASKTEMYLCQEIFPCTWGTPEPQHVLSPWKEPSYTWGKLKASPKQAPLGIWNIFLGFLCSWTVCLNSLSFLSFRHK